MINSKTTTVVRICGGLGNQFFQLGSALLIASKGSDACVVLDDYALSNYQVSRDFELSKFIDFSKGNIPITLKRLVITKLRIPRLFSFNNHSTRFVNDKNIKTPEDMAGKRITVLDTAPETGYLAKRIGMTPVSSSIMNALQKFNNHAVDITGAPGLAYEPMEMYKGLEPNGGIIKWPSLQVTMQLIVRWNKIPEGFAQKSRELLASQYLNHIKTIEQSENTIPEKYWIEISDEAKNNWNETFRESRIALREQKVYNAKALTLFRKVRCKVDPNLAECTSKDKE